MSIVRGLERIGGLQTQYAPSAYIGLWSRLRSFRRQDLTTALERRQVIQATLMRVTIHMVSAADYPLLTEAIRKGRREWWMGVQRHQVEGLDMRRAAAVVRAVLRDGPKMRVEMAERVRIRDAP